MKSRAEQVTVCFTPVAVSLYPVGDALAIVMGELGGGQGRMPEVVPDVLCRFEASGVEAVSMHLEAAMVFMGLGDDVLQSRIGGRRWRKRWQSK
jgi:hypothetical protein